MLRTLKKEEIYLNLTENSFLGKFELPLSKTSFIGYKWQINGYSEGDNFKQNILLKRFDDKLKSDSKKWIDENVPQLIFPELKQK